MIVNLDGRFVPRQEANFPADDGALLYGDSLFETLKARAGKIRFLEAHLDRIELAAGLLRFPLRREEIRRGLLETAARLESPAARLRLTVSRGSFAGLLLPPPEHGRFMVQGIPYLEPREEERRDGVACVYAPNRRVNPLSHLPQMKRGNYADCLYAANHARARGAREALFTSDGLVLEGATSNLFLLRGRTLITPPAGELVLAGIMRRQVMTTAPRLGLAVEERAVTCDELPDSDEAFITNALIDLLPIASLEGRSLARGSVTEKLRRAVEDQANDAD